MKRVFHLTAFAACVTVAATSMAQPPGGGREGQRGPGGQRGLGGGGGPGGGGPLQHLLDTFSDVDTDDDGMLSEAELQSAISGQKLDGRGRPGGHGGPPPREGEHRRGPKGQAEPGGPGGPGGPERRGGPEGPGGPGGRRGPGGPGGPERRGGPGAMYGAPPRPGIVLPDFVIESLGLSEEQRDKLAALQNEVDKQLAEILTEEQKQEMADHQSPPLGPGHEFGNRKGGMSDRPQRPQRPE